jgi:hypothetical protein
VAALKFGFGAFPAFIGGARPTAISQFAPSQTSRRTMALNVLEGVSAISCPSPARRID